MLATARAAAERGVAIGAHVAYRDLIGFGRPPVHVTPDELYADVVHQLGAMAATAHVAGTAVTYVKPHALCTTPPAPTRCRPRPSSAP